MGECFLYGNGGVPSTGIPEFTYTGEFLLINDGDKNWRIKFLTSGTLTFTKLNSAANGIDVFCVGAGSGGNNFGTGGGGGGGYTTTSKGIVPALNTAYEIVIGAGGAAADNSGSVGTYGANGGKTSAFGVAAEGGVSVSGGEGIAQSAGGNGGSGGGYNGYPGGTDGDNGGNYRDGVYGIGQGTTTREFGEESGDLYASGGYGSNAGKSGNADPNTGDGGHGAANNIAGNGGSGIVVIRNARR